MMVLCILLAMLSLFLSLKLIYQRKLVQKVKKQIDFLIDRDTQTEIMVEKTDGTIQDLAASINHLLKKYRSMGQEIERSDTLFRDTITSLSHDLRTPLATANGYIQLLQEQDLTGEQKEYVTIAGERISAVKLLLDQLFEFARIEADELKLNCRNTDIHSVLRDVVASYYGDFEQKKCVPYIVIPNPPAIIWGDPNALTRIFSNVVYNALVHGEGNYQITAAIEEAQGKNYGVLGPNGAGKTTLFKSMLGLTDFSGEILSDGQPVSSRCFGSLIEYPAFYSRLTVEENLNLHAQYLGLKQPNIEAALKQVNLLDARKKLFSQLSLGMRQRLGIARAFLGDVQYLLLDEPTNGLDPMGIKEIRLLLKERLKSPQHCILVSSHNLTEIAAVTDVLIFIRGGKIIKIVKNDYNEKELEALYEDIMTSGQREEA